MTTTPATTPTTEVKPGTETTTKPEAAALPDKYEFKAPEGTEIDAELSGKFATVAKELGLTQEAAQKLADFHFQGEKARMAADTQRRAAWGDATKADKDIGGEKLDANLGLAKKAMETYFPPEFKEMLNVTGLGNHLAVVKGLVAIGKTLSESSHVPGTQPANNAPKSIEERLYPNHKPA